MVDKRAGLEALQQELDIAPAQTAFIGNDLNDLSVRPACGLLVVSADGIIALRRNADLVLRHRGGQGALRELTEALLASQGQNCKRCIAMAGARATTSS